MKCWTSSFEPYDGILVPGGFGKRGIEGMIRAAKYARTRKVPYFGICLGMECAVIEFARNVCGLQADSSEFDPSAPHRVFYMLRELLGSDIMGGNMRLGAYPCELDPDSLAFRIYGKKEISERHRHRYEFNREYEKIIVSYGMRFSGNSPDGNFVEIAELPDHPWYLGCQFHPGVQVQAHAAASAVRELHRRFLSPQDGTKRPRGLRDGNGSSGRVLA